MVATRRPSTTNGNRRPVEPQHGQVQPLMAVVLAVVTGVVPGPVGLTTDVVAAGQA